MEYVTFTNAAGIEHKAWARKDGDNFICLKLEDASSQPERLWPQKVFTNKEEADDAILKYVEIGIKAKVFKNKRVE